MREHSVCLLMDNFQTLPSEQELVDWLDEEVWKDEEDARTQVMEGFRFLSIEHWAKRMILTVSAEEQVNAFLKVMGKEVERGPTMAPGWRDWRWPVKKAGWRAPPGPPETKHPPRGGCMCARECYRKVGARG